MPSELICLQCRKTHVDQEHVGPENRVDEANDRSHVVDEEQVEAMKKYDHRGNHVKGEVRRKIFIGSKFLLALN